jgi:hypothetical protein
MGYTALVAPEKFKELKNHKWFAKFGGNGGQPYAARGERYKKDGIDHTRTIRMHREIMNCPPDKEVDHRDGDTMHNWEGNLKTVDKSVNLKNRFTRPPPKYNQEIIESSVV